MWKDFVPRSLRDIIDAGGVELDCSTCGKKNFVSQNFCVYCGSILPLPSSLKAFALRDDYDDCDEEWHQALREYTTKNFCDSCGKKIQ